MESQRAFQGPGILGPGMTKPDPGGMGQFGGDFVGGGGFDGGGFAPPPMQTGIGGGGFAPDMSGGGMQAGGFGKPQENKYDRFANAMMNARGRRGMGGRPMAKPMLGGMGGPMTRPQAPRGGMQQSPPIVPQQMTNDLQSAVQGLQQKPGRLTQPGSPVLTAPAGIGGQ